LSVHLVMVCACTRYIFLWVVIWEDDGGLWVLERSDGGRFLNTSSTTSPPSQSSAPTFRPGQIFYTRSTELDPDYTLITTPAFCIWRFFTLLFPLTSTWGYFSLLHIHSTDIYRCGVRRFIFIFVVGAGHQMEDMAWRQ
jgi:hypothetical protein